MAKQEVLLLEDLLSALLGIPGRYIIAIPAEEDEKRRLGSLRAGRNGGYGGYGGDDSSRGPVTFVIHDDGEGMDPSLKYLTERVLPLCDAFARVSTFLETHRRYEFGMVVHALVAAIQELAKEYTLLVAQLEHQMRQGLLTLQKLFFYVQPSLRTYEVSVLRRELLQDEGVIWGRMVESGIGVVRVSFSITTIIISYTSYIAYSVIVRLQLQSFTANDFRLLFPIHLGHPFPYSMSSLSSRPQMTQILQSITEKAAFHTGGALLNVIHGAVSMHGDRKARFLCMYLLRRASVPFFEMVGRWTSAGVVHDPYGEFMVCEDLSIERSNLLEDFNSSYWRSRYTIRKDKVPIFLSRIADKILTTGKYLNVFRECGHVIDSVPAEVISYEDGERSMTEKIDRAYAVSSRTLLDLLLNEKQLVARLRSLKHYFLLDTGDFFVHFLDAAEDELRRPTHQVRIQPSSTSGL